MQLTIQATLRLLNELYLPEVGDKLIKLSIQLVVMQLNTVIETINSQGQMQTQQLLKLLEDLNQFQDAIHNQVGAALLARLEPIGGTEQDVEGLLSEVDTRFELMSKPCIDAIGRKLQIKLSENI